MAYIIPRFSYSAKPGNALTATPSAGNGGHNGHNPTKGTHHQYGAENVSRSEADSRKRQDEVDVAWRSFLHHYMSELNAILDTTRIRLASSADTQASHDLLDHALDSAKQDLSNSLTRYSAEMGIVLDQLPPGQVQSLMEYWRDSCDSNKKIIQTFDKAFTTSLEVIVELHARSLKQCAVLRKETDSIYQRLVR